MNKLYFFLIGLVFLSIGSYATDNATKKKSLAELLEPTMNTVVTKEQKDSYIKAFIGALKVVSGRSLMEDQQQYFGEYVPFSPKRPPLKVYSFKNKGLINVSFKRPDDNILWNESYISFSGDNKNIYTNFLEKDFTESLQLDFIGVKEERHKFDDKNIPEIFHYVYSYKWKLDHNIKVEFSVQPNKFNKDEKFPSNFFKTKIYRED